MATAVKAGSREEALVQGVLDGNRLLLSRTITRVENEQENTSAILSNLFPHTGKAHIIGVTGAPGTGKSTLVTLLAKQYREVGISVGVVAVDPTSPFTGGAILGDRVRMRTLSGDTGIFIRSMATRGSLGGLSKATNDVVMVLDAAGFERIIVETVGVGQAEVAIASAAHTTLVVEAPGLGDEVQAIKAGVLEIADILVVNKADRPGVDRTVKALQMMLNLGGPRQIRHHGQLLEMSMPLSQDEQEASWQVPLCKTVATTGENIEKLSRQIEEHREWLLTSNDIEQRESLRITYTLETILRNELNRRILTHMPSARFEEIIQLVRERKRDPYSAAADLLSGL